MLPATLDAGVGWGGLAGGLLTRDIVFAATGSSDSLGVLAF